MVRHLNNKKSNPVFAGKPTAGLMAISSLFVALPALAQQNTTTLSEINVKSQRDSAYPAQQSSVTGFGEQAILQTPASVSVIPRELYENQGARIATDVLVNDASVQENYAPVGYYQTFAIRGYALDNKTAYKLNGLTIDNESSMPLENKERIEVLKGVSALQSGFNAPGGILNYVTKRPTANLYRAINLGLSERGSRYIHADIGNHFGVDRQFAYRFNAAQEELRSYVKGANGNRSFASAAFDWKLSPQALLQLDIDYQKLSQLSVPAYQLLGGTTVPQGVSPDTMLNNQTWSKPVQTETSNVGGRFDYQINDDWQAYVAINRNKILTDDNVAFPYGCSNGPSYSAQFCANGDYDLYDYRSLGQTRTSLQRLAVLQGKLTTGLIKHDVSIAYSTLDQQESRGASVFDYVGFSNIYNPTDQLPASPNSPGLPVTRIVHEQKGLALYDVMALSPSFKLHLGLKHSKIDEIRNDSTGVLDNQYRRSINSPTAAIVYSPTTQLSYYASYSEGIETGGVAPRTANNAGQAFDPVVSKQYEIGAKSQLNQKLAISTALFAIRRPLIYLDGNSNNYIQQGESQNQGIEVSASGNILSNLRLFSSATYLHATQENTANPAYNGKQLINAPKFKSSIYAEYDLPQVPNLTINGAWIYSAAKSATRDESVSVPGYHVVNAGLRYVINSGQQRTTLRLNIQNLFNKLYWKDAGADSGGDTYIHLGASRLFKLSAQFQF